MSAAGGGEASGQAAGWPSVRLGDVADIVNGTGFPESEQGKTGLAVPFVKVSDLNNADGAGVVHRAVHTVSLETARELGARVCPVGAVVFPKVGGALLTNKKRVLGVAAAFDNNVMGAVPRGVSSSWLYHWLCSVDLAALANTQSLPSIRQSQVAELRIPLPPLPEQERLAAELTAAMAAVDRARLSAEERLAAAEALPATYYREAFGPEAPFDASPVVPDEPVRPGWSWHRLTDLARLATGHTPSRRHPEYWNGDIPWLQLPDIRALDGKRASDTSEHTNALGIENSAAVLLPEGTVCMSRTASVGFVTVMGRPMATSQDFVNWVCGPDLDAVFLMHLLIRSRGPIRDLGSGAVHHTIYFPTVEAFSVCVPPLAEQRRIAAELAGRLEAAESLIARCREQLAAVEALPAALLRQAFGSES